MYYIYMIRCENDSIYTGITNNIEKRMEEHFGKDKKCAKYTKSHTVKDIEIVWKTDTKSNAAKLEYHIKKSLTKKQKEELIIKNNLKKLLSEKIDFKEYKKMHKNTVKKINNNLLQNASSEYK